MTVPMVAFAVSTSGETPTTVAVSASVLNSRVKLTRAVCCTCNSRSRATVLKPESSVVTVYVPGGNAGKSNRPTSLLAVVRVALVALFITVTVAPGTTAPVESFTSPVMVPSVCAKEGAQRSNHVNPTSRVRAIRRGSFREQGAPPVRQPNRAPTPIGAVTGVTSTDRQRIEKAGPAREFGNGDRRAPLRRRDRPKATPGRDASQGGLEAAACEKDHIQAGFQKNESGHGLGLSEDAPSVRTNMTLPCPELVRLRDT